MAAKPVFDARKLAKEHDSLEPDKKLSQARVKVLFFTSKILTIIHTILVKTAQTQPGHIPHELPVRHQGKDVTVHVKASELVKPTHRQTHL